MAASARIDRSRLLGVGEVSERSGVPVSTLHFWEAKGLLQSLRSGGNQRRYDRGVLRRVAVIRVAQRAGIPLAEIKATFDTLPSGRAPDHADWAAFSTLWRNDLEARIAELSQLRDQIDQCIGCGCLSLGDCPLRNPEDTLAREGPGPRLLVTPQD
jgi:MerR family redox-sensitive transcriptional activator SoxR